MAKLIFDEAGLFGEGLSSTLNEFFELKKRTYIETSDVSEYTAIPIFLKPQSSVKLFHGVFPLPKVIFRKWRKGIVLKCSKPSVRHVKSRPDTCSEVAVTLALLKAEIIEPCSNGPYMAHLFNIPKKPDTVRPIVNLSRISKEMKTPPMDLCSLFQLMERRGPRAWIGNLWYVKFDFSQAFYNIPVKRSSRRFLAFKVDGCYYRFRVLPFGLGMAPSACQTFLESILRYIRKRTPYVHGHIDDILVGARSKRLLTRIVNDLLIRFKRIKWIINEKKCSLDPQRSLVFLGSVWNGAGIQREMEATFWVTALIEALGSTVKPLKEKQAQIIAGYLNYYLQFAGKLHSIIQRLVVCAGVDRKRARYLAHYLLVQTKTDVIKFRTPARGGLTVYADATPIKMAAIVIYDESVKLGPIALLEALRNDELKRDQCIILQREVENTPIIETEIRALVLALEHIESEQLYYRFNVKLFTDSMPALYFFTDGSSKFSTWEDSTLCQLLAIRNRLSIYFDIDIEYVNTKINPADFYSRTDQ